MAPGMALVTKAAQGVTDYPPRAPRSIMSDVNFLSRFKAAMLAASAFLLVACGGGDGDSGASAPASQVDSPVTSGANSAPTIQGKPATSVLAGRSYSFQPQASDANGDALRFSAANLPPWAALNADTGRLTGTPTEADVGTYANIKISVSDGAATTSLVAFSITVTASGTGSATLSWTPPTENTDGSTLTDLASYRILYGRSAEQLDQSIDIGNPSISSYVVENLTAGAWYFAVVAVNSRGASSDPSNIASKTVS